MKNAYTVSPLQCVLKHVGQLKCIRSATCRKEIMNVPQSLLAHCYTCDGWKRIFLFLVVIIVTLFSRLNGILWDFRGQLRGSCWNVVVSMAEVAEGNVGLQVATQTLIYSSSNAGLLMSWMSMRDGLGVYCLLLQILPS